MSRQKGCKRLTRGSLHLLLLILLPLLLGVATLSRLRAFGGRRLLLKVVRTLDSLGGLGNEFGALGALGAILGRTLAFGACDIEVRHNSNYRILVYGGSL